MARCSPGARITNLRSAFTLLELILALGLSVLAMGILVGLVQMYTSNFQIRGEDIRRAALARSLLNMIADDLRCSVSKQEFDASVLKTLMLGQSAGGGGGGGGSQGGGQSGQQSNAQGSNAQGSNAQGNSSGNGQNSGAAGAGAFGTSQTPLGSTAQSSQSGQAGGSGGASAGGSSSSGSTDGSTSSDGTATDTTTISSLPLGIYGSLTQLSVDVSRLPRPDEYMVQQASIMSGQLTDVPGDIKSVTYFVQVPSTMGVADRMNEVTTTPDNAGMAGGLVRRQIDRAVVSTAEEMGQADQVLRTGEVIAPEVLSLEFSFFDGTQWLTDWDSSSQGQPLLVEISLAMQSKSGERTAGLIQPGISLSTMPYEERAMYGIEVYTLTVTIPGAQTQATTATTTDAAAGMEAAGL